jgi:hypothetical protein
VLNTTFNGIVSTTLKAYDGSLADNITGKQRLLWMMDKMGAVIEVDPGSDIVVPLQVAENSTVRSYSGYGYLDTTPQEEFNAANYDWKQMGGTFSISGRERALNSGSKTQVVDLVAAKMDTLEKTCWMEQNEMLFSDGTGNSNQDIVGLQAAVENGDAWSTYGGIDSNANTFWRNQFYDAADYHTFSNVRTGMDQLWIDVSRGDTSPHMLISTITLWRAYEATLTTNERYIRSGADVEAIAASGFAHVYYKTAPYFYDEDCLPNGTGDDSQGLLMLNLDYLKLRVCRGVNWVFTDMKEPVDQDAFIAQLLWMGNLTLANRARQGRLDAATS